MKYKILIAFLFISQIVSAQFVKQSLGGSPTTINTVRGAFKADSSIAITRYIDTATANLGVNVKKQDALLIVVGDTVFLRDATNSRWVPFRTFNGNGQGVDSVILSNGQLCQWSAGLSTCYAVGSFYDSVALNVDSTFLMFYSGGIFIDSIYLPKSPVFGSSTVTIGDTTVTINGNPVRGYIIRGSGGGGSQTWQQTLNVPSGSVLTQDNTVDNSGHLFVLGNLTTGSYLTTDDHTAALYVDNNTYVQATSSDVSMVYNPASGKNSIIQLSDTAINIYPSNSSFNIPIYLGRNVSNGARSDIHIDPRQQATTPTYNLVLDGDTIKKYPYSGGSGSVTSVGLTSSDITVGGATSPITSSGTYTLALPTVNSNVGTFTNSTVTVNGKGQVTAVSSGIGADSLNWSVLDSLSTPPVSPSTGDIYEVGTSPTGAWAGQAGKIATWNGSSWTFQTATTGDLLYNAANAITSRFNGTTWVRVNQQALLHQGGEVASYGTVVVGSRAANNFNLVTNGLTRATVTSTGQFQVNTLTAGGFVKATPVSGALAIGNAVDSIWRTAGQDSIKFSINGRLRSIKDSTGGGTAPDSSWNTVEFGIPYPTPGILYDTAFQSQPFYFVKNAPNVTSSFSGKMIASGGKGWYNYFQSKYFDFDKEQIQYIVIPQSKNATDSGVGISFSRHVPSAFASQDIHLVVKYDLSNGTDSGRISIGYDTATFLKKSNPVAFNAGDTLLISLKREGWALTATMLNKANNKEAKVTIYNSYGIGTGGKLNFYLRSLGTIHVTRFTVNSWNRKNSGIAVLETSIANTGASTEMATYPSILFNANKSRYSTFGFPSITTDSMITAPLPDIISGGFNYCIVGGPYNDYHYQGTDTTVFRVKYDTLLNRLMRAGITPILLNLFPATTTSNGSVTEASFNTCISNFATTYSLRLVDINTPLKNGGTTIFPNYLAPDNVHPSDSAHIVISNTIFSRISDILNLYIGDSTSFVTAYNVPSGATNMAQLVVGADNKVYQVPSNFRDSSTLILNAYNSRSTGNSTPQKNADIRIDGIAQVDSMISLRNRFGGLIGFNASAGTNIEYTNGSAVGTSSPQTFAVRGGGTNNVIFTSITATAGNASLSGSKNVFLGFNAGNLATSASNNFVAQVGASGSDLTTGLRNVIIGNGKGQSTASDAILIGLHSQPAGNLSNRIHIGVNDYATAAAGETVLAPTLTGATFFYPFGKANFGGSSYTYRSTTMLFSDRAADNTFFDASAGNGIGPSGDITFRTWVPAATTVTQTVNYNNLRIERSGVAVASTTSTLTKATDLVLDAQSTTQGFAPPRVSQAQKLLIPTGVLTLNTNVAGTGITSGGNVITFTGGGGSGATGFCLVSGGAVVAGSAKITNPGSGYTSAPTAVLASGSGYSFIVTVGSTQGNNVFDTTTKVMSVWDGGAWQNGTRTGTFLASGTGAATTISIPHGMTGITTSSRKWVTPNNSASAGISYVTIDATNVNIVYTVAPLLGTNNLSFDIMINP